MAEIHHIVSGRKRHGHDHTIPLCAYHHRGVLPPDVPMALIEDGQGPSRHYHGRTAFEKHWGTEKDLLAEVDGKLQTQLATYG